MNSIVNKQKLVNDITLNVAQTLAFGKAEPELEFAFVQLLRKYNTYFSDLDINGVFREASIRIPSQEGIMHSNMQDAVGSIQIENLERGIG